MACTCMTQIDEKLKEHNSRLQVTFSFGAGSMSARPYIGTEKLNKRNRDHCGAIASFCPFCGTSYAEPKEQS